MASTLRNIVSDLASSVRAFNRDDRISYRFLSNLFKSKLAYLLRLESKTREIFKDFNIWQTIECVELCDVPTNSCGYIDNCNTLKRSRIQLPKSYSTIYGPIVKVYSIDRRQEFTFIYSGNYKDYTMREYSPNKNVFWIQDAFVYIPNTSIENVIVMILADDPIQVDKLNGCADGCSSPLDGLITYPEYLITLAKQEALKEISGVYTRSIEDEKGDDNTNRKT